VAVFRVLEQHQEQDDGVIKGLTASFPLQFQNDLFFFILLFMLPFMVCSLNIILLN